MKKVWLVFVSLIICELLLRILGFKPYISTPFYLKSTPSHFLAPNDTFGFALNPGSFNVNINGLDFKANHNYGNTRKVLADSGHSKQSVLHLYGCSFAYGFGISDSATLATQLQHKLGLRYKVKSFAVPGHGDVQGLLKLKNQIKQGQKPNLVIFGFCYFHAQRNVLNANYRIHIKQGLNEQSAACRFPYVASNQNQFNISFEPAKSIYKHWLFRRKLSLVNLFQTTTDALFNAQTGQNETQWVFMQLKQLCAQNDIRLIIAPLTRHKNMSSYISFFNKQNIAVANTMLNIADSVYNNQPFDSHPNGIATAYYAQKIVNTINKTE
ncbi:MAG: hypothetical protein ACPGLV_06025 [Bacteroidia bacterium]